MEWWQMYPAAGRIRGIRRSLIDRIRFRRRRRAMDDLAFLRRR